MTHLLEARPPELGPAVDGRDRSDGPDRGDGATAGAGSAYDVTWRDLGWEELVAEAARLGRDARFADLTDAEVEDRLAVGAAQLDAALCRWLELLAELVVRQVWADQGARTPAAWLSWRLGIAPSTAREQVRVALALRDFPATRDRFAAGTLSYSKVRAITRCGRPSCEDLLLTWADDATAQRLEQVARAFRTAERAVHDADAVDEDPLERCTVRSRSVDTTRRELVIAGPADRIVAVEDALRRLGERSAAARRASDDGGAGGVLVDDEVAVPPDEADSDGCSPAQARWRPVSGSDQLEALEVALAAADADGAVDTTGADRHTLVLHASVDDVVEPTAVGLAWRNDGDDDHGADVVAVHDDHARVRGMDRRALRRLACDAGIVLVVTDGDGCPVDVGRRSRATTAALRRALRRRDGGCTFPGCGQTRHLHAHHVLHWADGGPTDLGNLVLLCGHHHRFVHARDWRIEVRRDGRHRYRTAAGEVPRVGARSSAPATAVGRHAPRTASAEALLPRTYLGGPYDLDLAVAVLQEQHRRERDGTAVAA